jgi:hypothetical protein
LKCNSVVADDAAAAAKLRNIRRASKKTNEREEAKGADDDNAERTAFVQGSNFLPTIPIHDWNFSSVTALFQES